MQVLALKCDTVPVTCCAGTAIHQRTLFPDVGKCIHSNSGGRQASGWVSRDDQMTSVYEIAGHIGTTSFCAPSMGGAGGMEWGRGGR